jgi:hypothetical protein
MRRCPILLLMLAAILARPAWAQPLGTTQRPPIGFELFDAPQSTLVDLYVDAARVGRVMVTFTPTQVQIQDPSLVLPLIGPVLNPVTLGPLLARNFPTNSALVCSSRRRPPLCGDLTPSDVGVIFDATTLRLDVFINPTLRATQGAGIEFLKAGSNAPSALMSYGGALSLGLPRSAGSQNYSGFVQADAARGDYHYSARLLSLSNHDLALDIATIAKDVRDWSFTAGLLDDEAIPPLVAGRLLGASAETSFNLRSKPESLYGTPIILFVPRRAQVDIFRGARLLSSRQMEAGNQTLDTSDLPEGAYDLTIRLTDAGGAVQIQHRYFIKSHDFAPDGQPYFHFDVGMREPYDAATGALIQGPLVAHAATKARALDWLSLNLDLFYFGRTLFAGPGMVAVLDGVRVGLRGIESTRHDQAFAAYALAQLDPLFFHADITGLMSGLQPKGAAALHPLDPVGPGFYQGTIAVDYARTALSMGISAGYRRQSGVSQPIVSPNLRVPILQTGPVNLVLALEATWTGRATTVLFHLTAFENPTTGGISRSADAGYRFGNGRGSPDISAAVNWQDPNAIGFDRQVQARAQQAFDQSLVALIGAYRGPEGRIEANLQGAATKQGALSGLAGGQFFGTVTFDDGHIDFGGTQTQASAIVVVIDGGPPGSRFSVLINGAPIGYAVAGEATPVPLTPYRRYQISLRPPLDQLLAMDLRAEEVTLLPGMVKRMTWTVDAVKVVIARIVLADGQPLSRVVLAGAVGPTITGEDGWVQMEARDQAQIIALDHLGARRCHITMPDLKGAGLVVNAGDLICR